MDTLTYFILSFLGLYYLIANLSYFILLYFSARIIRERKDYCICSQPEINQWPKITIVAPAFNEANIIVNSINSYLKLDYPDFEIIVVDDGSTDDTLSLLIENFALKIDHLPQSRYPWPVQQFYSSVTHPNLKVISQHNTGKAQALNHGILFSKGHFICTVDSDSLLEKAALKNAMLVFIKSPENIVGVGGTVRIMNGSDIKNFEVIKGKLPDNHLAMFQVIEYIRAFYCGRLGWEKIGGTALLPGAFTVYRKSSLLEVGGFDPDSITEDFEILIRLSELYAKKNIHPQFHMIPIPVCWTLAPETLTDLYRQRLRWQRGLCQTIWKHKRLVFNPAGGRLGMLTLPYMFIFELLGPYIDLIAMSVLGLAFYQQELNLQTTFILINLGLSWGVIITLLGIRLEETSYARHAPRLSKWKFILYAFLENIGYRQFILFNRLIGTLTAFSAKNKWGLHQREPLPADTDKDLAA